MCCAEGEPDILLQRPEDLPDPSRDTFKGEPSVDLMNCTAEVATDYTKKKYVFRLRYVVFLSE